MLTQPMKVRTQRCAEKLAEGSRGRTAILGGAGAVSRLPALCAGHEDLPDSCVRTGLTVNNGKPPTASMELGTF